MTDYTKKQLKLKTSSCSRLLKEYLSYFKEEQREQERYQKMQEEGADELKLRQQKTVVDETSQMIPYCRNKLEAAFKDLQKVIADVVDEDKQWEEYIAAEKLINEILEQNIFPGN
jgi:tubulin-specific chaperone A